MLDHHGVEVMVELHGRNLAMAEFTPQEILGLSDREVEGDVEHGHRWLA